jgi:hypothetical protein
VWAEGVDGWKKLSAVEQFNDAPAAPAAAVNTLPSTSPSFPAAKSSFPAGGSSAALAPTPNAATTRVPDVSARPNASPSASFGAPSLGGRAANASLAGGVAGPPSIGLAGKGAPPSLGLARKRQGSVPPAASAPTGPDAASGGAGAAASAGAPLGGGVQSAVSGHGRSHMPSLAAGSSSGIGSAARSGGSALSRIESAGGAAIPAAAKGVSIPVPMMGDKDTEWGEGQGMRVIIGAEQRVRAIIALDGEVVDALGNTLAYIESNGEVGDAAMNYAGKAHLQAHQVNDHTDTLIGEFDLGRGYIKDNFGSVVAELTKDGIITDNGGQTIGVVEGFSFSEVPTMAAYFLIVDPGFVRSRGRSYVN